MPNSCWHSAENKLLNTIKKRDLIFPFSFWFCFQHKITSSLKSPESKDEQEIAIKSYLYQMSEEDRSKYEADYQALVKQKGRGFLTTDEQIQFYKDYGILN